MTEEKTALEASYDDFYATLEDPRTAFEVAKKLCEQDSERKDRLSKYHGGQKRHPGFGRYITRPLDGTDYDTSTKIRKIVGLRYSGFSDALIEKALDLYPKYIWRKEVKYPKAFEQARSELIKTALEEYHANVAFARAAVSEMGFKALETLFDIMNSPDTRPAIRLKAAEKVLSLTFGAAPSEGQVAGVVIDKMGDALTKIVSASKGDTYIHDAEEVTYDGWADIEGGSLESGVGSSGGDSSRRAHNIEIGAEMIAISVDPTTGLIVCAFEVSDDVFKSLGGRGQRERRL